MPRASPAVSLSKCAFVADDAARKNGACAPPPSAFAFETAPQIVAGTETFDSNAHGSRIGAEYRRAVWSRRSRRGAAE